MSAQNLAATFDAALLDAAPAHSESGKDRMDHVLVALNLPLALILLSLIWTPMVVLWFAVIAMPIYLIGLLLLSFGTGLD